MSKEAKLERNVSINPRSIMLGRGGKNLERPPSFPPLKTISDLGTQIGSEHNCQPALYMKTYYPRLEPIPVVAFPTSPFLSPSVPPRRAIGQPQLFY